MAKQAKILTETGDWVDLASSTTDLSAYATTSSLTSGLAAKSPSASPTFTGNVVWSAAVLRAATATVATSQTTASESYTDLATVGPAVTLTTGTKALVIISAGGFNANSGGGNIASFAVSGATTVAASDANMLKFGPNGAVNSPADRLSASVLLTGLTAGSNTFTMKYLASTGTAYFSNRTINVIDMGS